MRPCNYVISKKCVYRKKKLFFNYTPNKIAIIKTVKVVSSNKEMYIGF